MRAETTLRTLLAAALAALCAGALCAGCDGDATVAAPDSLADAARDAAAPDVVGSDVVGSDVVGSDDGGAPGTDGAADGGADAAPDTGPSPRTFVAVTFNTGTTETMYRGSPDDRYTEAHGAASDEWYGDGLAWLPAVAATTEFFAAVQPDVVVFQEIFWSGECPDVPEEARADFVCETWQEGDPTVAQVILGDGYQVACHPGKPDKCAAVKRAFGSFRGCDADFCLEGVTGYRVEDCGRGARVGRVVIDLVDGGALTLVNVHGSSGLAGPDMECRVQQFEQVFVDLGDGAPGANGEWNLVMGDLNTDPARLAIADPSARRWNEFVGEDRPFHYLTDVGEDVPTTYGAFGNIDHVVSDVVTGDCWTAGVTEGHPEVLEDRYFDHKPAVCTATLPQ